MLPFLEYFPSTELGSSGKSLEQNLLIAIHIFLNNYEQLVHNYV